MNAADRKRARLIAQNIDTKLIELEALYEELEGMAGDEESKFENMSESLQGGETGQAIEEAGRLLREAADDFESAKDSLESVVSNITSACD